MHLFITLDHGKMYRATTSFSVAPPSLQRFLFVRFCAAGDRKTRDSDTSPVVMPMVAASDADGNGPVHNNAQLALAARRRADDHLLYAVDCWMPRSTFTDASCNCLAEAAHPELGSRRTVKVVIGSWYASVARPDCLSVVPNVSESVPREPSSTVVL